jgi:hypothetical protein
MGQVPSEPVPWSGASRHVLQSRVIPRLDRGIQTVVVLLDRPVTPDDDKQVRNRDRRCAVRCTEVTPSAGVTFRSRYTALEFAVHGTREAGTCYLNSRLSKMRVVRYRRNTV